MLPPALQETFHRKKRSILIVLWGSSPYLILLITKIPHLDCSVIRSTDNLRGVSGDTINLSFVGLKLVDLSFSENHSQFKIYAYVSASQILRPEGCLWLIVGGKSSNF